MTCDTTNFYFFFYFFFYWPLGAGNPKLPFMEPWSSAEPKLRNPAIDNIFHFSKGWITLCQFHACFIQNRLQTKYVGKLNSVQVFIQDLLQIDLDLNHKLHSSNFFMLVFLQALANKFSCLWNRFKNKN